MQNGNVSGPAHGFLPAARGGGIIVLMVLAIVTLLSMVLISVDVAAMQLARTELRAASDAAAKAGAEALLRTQNVQKAREAAINLAALNRVAGHPLRLRDQDIIVGESTQQPDGSWSFSEGGATPNSVRVNAMLTQASGTGTVKLVFGKVFGSGNFEPTKLSTASVLEQEVCLAVDRSASMAWDLTGNDWSYPRGGAYEKPPHPTKSRWAALNRAVDSYVDIVAGRSPRPRVALVSWASDVPESDPIPLLLGVVFKVVKLEVPLTGSTGQVKSSMNSRGSQAIIGGTNMAAGIDEGVKILTAPGVKPFAKKTLILMTDGQWNQGRNPRSAAEDARDAGVVVHVITFLPGASSPDARAIAELTGGRHFQANDEAELIAAFEELARMLPVVLTE